MRGDEFMFIADMTSPIRYYFVGEEVRTMFDGLADVLTQAALASEITSYTSIPVVPALVLASIAITVVVWGARGLQRMSGHK